MYCKSCNKAELCINCINNLEFNEKLIKCGCFNSIQFFDVEK
jgi:hypothetical protein